MSINAPFLVLVVDDEPPISELLSLAAKKVFPEADFISTGSARETMVYLNDPTTTTPRLILLDINLGQEADGLALLPRLRSRFNGQVPIIIFSGIDDEAKVKEAYSGGAVSFAVKPDAPQGWRDYVAVLRAYWYESTVLPPKQ
ncbi:response regulator [Fibrella sp. ES10-3-2-2]|nr:hypothetical protein A6C57_00345 [Fibrella sp. ES10-3-2-2]